MLKRRIGSAALFSFAFATALSAAEPATTPPPAWVERSNANAQVLLKTMAELHPEFASRIGMSGYDEKVIDLKPGIVERQRTAMKAALADMQKKLGSESDANVKQDLQIMIKAAERRIDSSVLEEKYMLPYEDIGETIFQGEFALLQDQVAPERRALALKRLQCYVGITAGCTPVTKESEALFDSKLKDTKLIGPY